MLQGVSNLEEAKRNVLGGEVALWTEQADAFSMMSRSFVMIMMMKVMIMLIMMLIMITMVMIIINCLGLANSLGLKQEWGRLI